MSVLVVDDDPLVRSVICELIADMGLQCEGAANGKDAVALVEERSFGVVFVDMLMPEMDGVETIGRLRESRPALRIVAISGGAQGMTAAYLLRLAHGMGAHALLPKPFNERELTLALSDALS